MYFWRGFFCHFLVKFWVIFYIAVLLLVSMASNFVFMGLAGVSTCVCISCALFLLFIWFLKVPFALVCFFAYLFLQQARKKAEFGRMGGGEDLSEDKRGEIVTRIY